LEEITIFKSADGNQLYSINIAVMTLSL